MKEKISEIEKEIQDETLSNAKQIEDFRIKYLGSKGKIKGLFSWLKEVPHEEKREAGQLMNALRNGAQEKYDIAKEQLSSKEKEENKLDLSRPGDQIGIGSRHLR